MLLLLLIILIIHLVIKKINIEHIKKTDYDMLRIAMEKKKCKDTKCLSKIMSIQKSDKKKKLKIIGCLQSKDNIKIPLYKDNNNLYYSYDDDLINYNKLKKMKKKKKS